MASIDKHIKFLTNELNSLKSAFDKNAKSVDKNTSALNKFAKKTAEVSAGTKRLAKETLDYEQRMNLRRIAENERTLNKMYLEEQKHQNRLNLLNRKNQLSGGGSGGLSLSGLFAGYYAITRLMSMASTYTGIADTATATKARMGLYNESQYTTDELYTAMYGVSQRSRTDIADTGDLINRILVSGAITGEDSVIKSMQLGETIQKAIIAGGGTKEQNQRALLQLAQGLSSGTLQGDELRSIREQTPFLAEMLAKGLSKVAPELGENLAIGNLKKLGEEGELTSERILKAFDAMEDEINEKFSQMPRTFEQSAIQMSNVGTKFIENLTKSGGAFNRLNQFVGKIADYLMSEKGQRMLSRLTTFINGFADITISALETIFNIIVELNDVLPLTEMALTGIGVAGASALGSLITKAGAVIAPIMAVGGKLMLIVGALWLIADAIEHISGISKSKQFAGVMTTIETAFQTTFDFGKALAEGAMETYPRSNPDDLVLHKGLRGAIENGLEFLFTNDTSGNWDENYNQRIKDIEEWNKSMEDIEKSLDEMTSGNYKFNVGTVDEVKGTVDISSQDLKLLRDIASRDMLLNMTSVTPQATINFGDVRETADVNKIMEAIEDMVENAWATTLVTN